MPTALDDITVLDLSHALAGPFASTLLADFGARVIKVEPPGSGDIARAWGPPFYGSEPAYFVNLQRNKQSVAIDLKHAEGPELFLRLMERADVVLENYRVGTLEKLGIDYARARARHPGIIYCSVSGFGQTGRTATARRSISSCRPRAACSASPVSPADAACGAASRSPT